MSASIEATPVLCRFMGRSGHFTFGWSPDNDVEAERLITAKMAEGIVFRVMRRGVFRASTELQPVRDLADVPQDRQLIIDDADVARFLQRGGGRVVDEEFDEVDAVLDAEPTLRRARSAREVLDNDTVAHRPLAGG